MFHGSYCLWICTYPLQVKNLGKAHYWMIMENLSAGKKINQKYDIKGKMERKFDCEDAEQYEE